MAYRYWVESGGTKSGNWSDTSHWSTSQSGTGGASVPSSNDIVYIGSSTPSLYRDYLVNVDSNVTVDTLTIGNNSRLNSNGYSITTTVSHILVGGSGGTSDVSVFDCTNSLITVNANNGNFGFYIFAGMVIANGSTIRLNIGPSNNSADIVFAGKSFQFNSVILDGSNNNKTITLTGSNSFNSLTIIPRTTLLIETPSPQNATVNSIVEFNANGTSSLPITIRSTVSGRQHVFRKTSGIVEASFLDLKVSVANGGATFNNFRGINSGNVVGWNFTGPSMPVAKFNQSTTSGLRPLSVNFTDTSTGGDISAWLWTFGDGTTSTSQNPSKTYSSAGTYTVSLKVTNPVGDNTLTKTNLITTSVSTYPIIISGGFTLGGTLSRKLTAKRTIVGGFTMGGSVLAIRKGNTNAIQPKKFIAKVYDESGNYEGILDDMIDPGIEFTKEINSPGSSVEIELARNSDSRETQRANRTVVGGATRTDSNGFVRSVSLQSRQKVGPGSNIVHNNRVDIWQYYGYTDTRTIPDGRNRTVSTGEDRTVVIGYPNGRIKFSGFISQINTKYGSTETTNLTLLSYGYDLDQYLLDDNTGKTTIAYNSTDPANIMRQGLDRFMAVGMGTYTKYSSTSIDNTGTIVSYTFKANTYNELAKKVVELAPENWYWHVDLGSNEVNLHPRASTAKHVFYLGKHIKDLNLRSSIEGVVNDVLFTGGEVTEGDPTTTLYRRYKRTPGTYTRRGLERMSDSRVTLTDSADTLAEGKIEEVNQVQYKTSVTILDLAYPIEDIEVGDTVGFRNFDNFVDDLILQIVAYTYHADFIELQLDSLSPPVSKRLSDLKRNQETTATENVPDSPVTA